MRVAPKHASCWESNGLAFIKNGPFFFRCRGKNLKTIKKVPGTPHPGRVPRKTSLMVYQWSAARGPSTPVPPAPVVGGGGGGGGDSVVDSTVSQ